MHVRLSGFENISTLENVSFIIVSFFRSIFFLFYFNVLSYVNFKTPKYNIRNSEATLVKGLFKTDVFNFSFFNCIVDLWNCLPLGMRTIEHFLLFKSSINKFYLNKFKVNKDRFL